MRSIYCRSRGWALLVVAAGHILAADPQLTVTSDWSGVARATAVLAVSPRPIVLDATTRNSPTNVFVTWNKPVRLTGTYVIDGGALPVNSRAYGGSSNLVVLTTAPIAPDTQHTLLITNVTDPAGNLQAPNPTNWVFAEGPGRLCLSFNGVLPTNAALSGNAYRGADGFLHLTDATNNQQGSLVLDWGAPMTFFRASFRALMGDGSSPPADGLSFCYGSDVGGLFGEEGIGSGLIVSFDTYDNGGEGTPSIDLKWNGAQFAHAATPLITGPASFVDVVVEMSIGGQVTLRCGGSTIYNGVPIPGYTPITANARFGLGGRTGALNEKNWVDDFCINDGFTLGGIAVTASPPNPTVPECSTVIFSAAVSGSPPYSYQWQRNGVPIPGATGPSYSTPPLQCPQDQGAVYSVVVSNLFSRASASNAVTLFCDGAAPGILSVGSLNGCAVGVCFSEPVDPASASNPLNYRLDGQPPGVGIVPPILLRPDGRSIHFGVDPCLAGSFTVEADGVLDVCPARNAAPSSGVGKVQGWLSTDVGTPGDPNPPGTNYSWADQVIEISTGGSDTWDTADHNHFVYSRQSGDFDLVVKVTRLDYQSAWSKAGLMARVTLAADSAAIATYHTPTTGANQVEAGLRTTEGSAMFDWGNFRPLASLAPYLRLQRLGDQFFAYHSADGTNWSIHADSATALFGQWPASLFVGVFATPRNGNDGNITTAEFRGFGPTPECYSVLVPSGYSLIANQLHQGANTLNEIMPNVPPGSILYKWDNARQRWQVGSYDDAFQAWVPANFTLNPGEGAFFFNPGSPFTLTFCGQRLPPTLPLDLVRGWNLVSRQIPEAGPYEAIVTCEASGGCSPPQDGTEAARWNGGGYDLATYIEGLGWDPFEPTVGVGEPLFVLATPGGPASIVTPPGIAEPPSDQTVLPGFTVVFTVTATGSLPLAYQWRLNGLDVPGATHDTLTISNVQIRDLGRYSVKVENAGGACISRSAALGLLDLPTPGGDNFADRRPISGSNSRLVGNNLGFTSEPGEPLHAGKPGGRSAWYTWTAPAHGIATFSTTGSQFDTLLAIYTGTNLASLVPVAADDDGGGHFTSRAQFTANAGVVYQIAIDGRAGRQGEFVLVWQLEPTTQPLPVIVSQPASLTVPVGATATFSVVATGSALSYHWFHNGRAIGGAVGSSFMITNVQPGNAGRYTVAVTNSFGRGLESVPATLELGSIAAAQTRDKVEDLYGVSGSQSVGGAAGRERSLTGLSGGFAGFLSVTAGTTDSHTLDNTGAGYSPGEPLHCGVLGGSSQWFGLKAEDDGVMIVDTIGAEFDTVLAVYSAPPTYTETFWFEIQLVACDDNSAPDGRASQVAFTAHRGTSYAIAVDGVGGKQGLIPLHYRLHALSDLLVSSTNALVHLNGDLALKAQASGLSSPIYRWRLGGVNIPDATNRTLALANIQFSQGGDYAVVIRNPSQSVTQSIARLTVAQLSYKLDWGGTLPSFTVTGKASAAIVLDWGTNMPLFEAIWTNQVPLLPFGRTDPLTATTTQRWFRLRPSP